MICADRDRKPKIPLRTDKRKKRKKSYGMRYIKNHSIDYIITEIPFRSTDGFMIQYFF